MRIHPLLVLASYALLSSAPVRAADKTTGEQIYRAMCASCHGTTGEGTKVRYPRPLAGDLSLTQLSNLIAKTMPDDDPGACTGADADKVAAYIYDAFYSRTARERNRPARIELARLTVKQYRNTVADVIGGFRSTSGKWDDKHGLRAEYYSGRRFLNDKRVLERIDPEVGFDFGTEGPVAGKTEPHEFLIRWSGSVMAPETGEYEFVVRTEHATRLWVNDTNRALIDAWVKSGKDTEYRGSIFLIAGRVYPLKLEYAKAKQGVDDSKTNKTKPPPVKSSIRLEWKPPQQALQVIAARNLSPNTFPESFAVSTPFPPDDRSYGWERGTTVSKAWDQATTEAALETASYVVSRLAELSGTRDAGTDRDTKLRDFGRRFAERAFRRPLSEEQKKAYIDRQFEAAKDPEIAVKRVVLLVLKSPRFLYREVGTASDAYDVAARLSFGLWDSLPDQPLLDAAAAGQLTTREQVARQAERMMGDLRARSKLRDFYLQWLKIDRAPDLAKSAEKFPGFDAAVISDLRTSLELSLDDVSGLSADFRQLLLAEDVYLNGRLAKFYGVDLPADAAFQKVKLNPEQRAGVLTHPYIMAAFAHTNETSPIHRGVFLARGVLGVALRPPPEAVAPLAADLHPSLTTRERVMLQTKPNNCMTCHGVINPLGFTLENFDAVGRFRDKDHGKPVEATGTYQTRAGKAVSFAGARDLARFLADSEEVHTAFTEQLFHHLVQQPVMAYGPAKLGELRQSFAANGFSVQKLAVEVMAASALTARK
jgi:cytochrome c5